MVPPSIAVSSSMTAGDTLDDGTPSTTAIHAASSPVLSKTTPWASSGQVSAPSGSVAGDARLRESFRRTAVIPCLPGSDLAMS
ncbi:hypothetical protein JM654_22610 [Microbacterium oxydans]|nr:hypothetical protein [Microbacterium oxydans]